MSQKLPRRVAFDHGSDRTHESRGNSPHAIGLEETNLLGSETLLVKLVRFPSVRERTGLSRSTIWRLERRGDFPRHRRISPNAVAWVEHEISEWIAARICTGAT